jgi:uncharacterized surface protein with fasciclin (FAS1) repeats
MHNRRTVLGGIATGITALGASAGVAAAGGHGGSNGRRKGASADKNLVEKTVELNSSGPFAGRFDELIDAVTAAGLVDALSGPDTQLTVFAPVDAGFENVYQASDTIDEAADVPAGVLLYHVTNGRRYERSVVNAPAIKMLTGGTVTVDGTTLNDGQAEIIATDVEASNGVIHAIAPGDPGVLLQ